MEHLQSILNHIIQNIPISLLKWCIRLFVAWGLYYIFFSGKHQGGKWKTFLTVLFLLIFFLLFLLFLGIIYLFIYFSIRGGFEWWIIPLVILLTIGVWKIGLLLYALFGEIKNKT